MYAFGKMQSSGRVNKPSWQTSRKGGGTRQGVRGRLGHNLMVDNKRNRSGSLKHASSLASRLGPRNVNVRSGGILTMKLKQVKDTLLAAREEGRFHDRQSNFDARRGIVTKNSPQLPSRKRIETGAMVTGLRSDQLLQGTQKNFGNSYGQGRKGSTWGGGSKGFDSMVAPFSGKMRSEVSAVSVSSDRGLTVNIKNRLSGVAPRGGLPKSGRLNDNISADFTPHNWLSRDDDSEIPPRAKRGKYITVNHGNSSEYISSDSDNSEMEASTTFDRRADRILQNPRSRQILNVLYGNPLRGLGRTAKPASRRKEETKVQPSRTRQIANDRFRPVAKLHHPSPLLAMPRLNTPSPPPTLPEPHRQTLDPRVQKEIAILQGRVGAAIAFQRGPGIKNFTLMPNQTRSTLSERFKGERMVNAVMDCGD